MPSTVLLTGLPEEVAGRIRTLAGESGFTIEIARNRDECQEVLLNQEILALIIHASMVAADSRIIEVMKFYSNSVQFIVYAEDDAAAELSGLPRSDIIGVIKGPAFTDDTLTDFLTCAVRLNSLDKKVESLNFALQENHSVASELNLKNKVLERERNFNDSIINSIAYGLMISDTDGAIMLINEMGKRIFGITASDFYGMNYETVVFEGIRESLSLNVKEVLKSHKTMEVEGFNVRDDLVISYSLSVIKDNFGNVIGLMFLGRDVTEWENMTHQLFQAEKLATMGTMLSGIAHELRNPVTIINARAQRILQSTDTPVPEKTKKAVESIENQSKRMGEIINNLLDFSRRNVSGFALADINEIVNVAVSFLTLEGRDVGVEIIKSFGEGCQTRCDRNQMEQVFLNLFTNACDAMQNKGKLFLTTENSENYIRISVRDTGCGIPEELKKKIFFIPSSPPRRRAREPGWVWRLSIKSSRRTKGVWLSGAKQARGPLLSSCCQRAINMQQKGRILLVDDEPDLLDILSEFLEEKGYGVATACDGLKALEVLAADPNFDLLLSDINMPRMKGFELIHEARAKYPRLKSALITAYDINSYIELANKYNVGNIIAKTSPFNFNDLLVNVESWISGNIFGVEKYFSPTVRKRP